MASSHSLGVNATTANLNTNIELAFATGEFKWSNHFFTPKCDWEVRFERLTIYCDNTITWGHLHAGSRGFAATNSAFCATSCFYFSSHKYSD